MASGICLAAPASGQTVRGLLLEASTERPIELGTVALVTEGGDTVAAALSDESGLYSLTAPEAGTYTVLASALGYVSRGRGPIPLEDDQVRIVQVALTPAPVPIEGVSVETTPIVITDDALLANGFYERMMQTRGQFLTPEAVTNSPARYTPQLLRGLDHEHPQYGASGWRTWVRVWSPFGQGTCVPRVYVDGSWVNETGRERYAEGLGLEDVVPRDEVKAVELYWGHQAPLGYRARDSYDDASADCGVVLIWTK